MNHITKTNKNEILHQTRGELDMGNNKNMLIIAVFVFIGIFIVNMVFSEDSVIQSASPHSINIELVQIEPGSFLMGNQQETLPPALVIPIEQQIPDPEDVMIDGDWDERPVHPVTLTLPFHISATEVTIEQFKKFRPDYQGNEKYAPYATGISWEDAMAFCQWLTTREGREYRLPTEAEWEYVARAGTNTPFWSGSRPPEETDTHPWGVQNMHNSLPEWCFDWYGPYPDRHLYDPVGAEYGNVRVIRGGVLEEKPLRDEQPEAYFQRSANRGGMPPNFSEFKSYQRPELPSIEQSSTQPTGKGLTGMIYGSASLYRPQQRISVMSIDSSDPSWNYGNDQDSWSLELLGFLVSPVSGEVNFQAEANNGIILEIAGERIIDGWGEDKERTGSFFLEAKEPVPIRVAYYMQGSPSFLRLYWKLPGKDARQLIPGEAFRHSERQVISLERALIESKLPARNPVGFRVVQAPLPDSQPWPVDKVFFGQGVKRAVAESLAEKGPDLSKPWYRRDVVYPMPPDSRTREEIDAAGLHPSFRGHNHSPGLVAAANGDLLSVIYTSYGEYDPGVSIMGTRLRYGAREWDFPSPVLDFPDVNMHAPLLWRDHHRLYLFFGNPRLAGAYPFAWMTSDDHGANWSPVHFPEFTNEVGPYTEQPINSIIKFNSDTFLVSSDGHQEDAISVLWRSTDGMRTWKDPGGRTGGRHTTFAKLEDGRILGLGGKESNIDGYMPMFISRDLGVTWSTEKSPFAALGSNQRPALIRLQSGHLFFAGDMQERGGVHPPGIKERGVLVGLSKDGGKTWITKKLPGVLPHEEDRPDWGTIGYVAARQAKNGIIHLTTSQTEPICHFELNEAWILSPDAGIKNQPEAVLPETVQSFKETWPDGCPRHLWYGGYSESGSFLLHGNEFWHFQDGRLQYRATWESGFKVGKETLWDSKGNRIWEWDHHPDGTKTWRQFYKNGRLKSESNWKNYRAESLARRWDKTGNLVSKWMFSDGHGTIIH